MVARYSNGTFGRVRHTKDVIFDMNVNFHSVDNNDLPSEQEFNNIPALQLVADADNADTFRRQLILPPALAVASTPDIPDPELPPDTDIPLPDPFIPEAPDLHNEIGSTYDEVGNMLYWYKIQHKDGDMKLLMVETMHHDCMKQMLYMEVRDQCVSSSYDKAIPIPMWKTAICIELEKFKKHNCLLLMHFDGQHLVPMKWIFSIETDGTYKDCLVGRGDLMIPWVDFNSKEVYCGNISVYGIELVLLLADSHKLLIRGGDLVRAYLATRANKDYPVYIKKPQRLEMDVPAGYCIQAVGNLYGFPPAGQNFSIEFDKCVK